MNDQTYNAVTHTKEGLKRELSVGMHVVFIDSLRIEREALVTCWHGTSCINLVMVSSDPKETDSYGRQMQRQTSVSHMSQNNYGNFWRWPDEVTVLAQDIASIK